MVTEELWKLRLTDEAPRIGSGYRMVKVKVGRKWVHLSAYRAGVLGATLKPRKQRISRGVWSELAASPFAQCLDRICEG